MWCRGCGNTMPSDTEEYWYPLCEKCRTDTSEEWRREIDGSTMESLVDKTVREIWLGEVDVGIDHSYYEPVILFVCDDGNVAYHTEGDCCSETWFADLIAVDLLIGHTVRETEARPIREDDEQTPEEKARTKQEYDLIYGIHIRTEAGTSEVVFRNSSNGYYGGSLHLTDPSKINMDRLKQITEDVSL